MYQIIFDYLIALFFTEVVELLATAVFGYRDKKIFLSVFAVNIITNPVINFVCAYYSFDFIQIIIAECFVVLFEAVFFVYVLKFRFSEAFRLSFIINAFSYTAGLFLPWDLIYRFASV